MTAGVVAGSWLARAALGQDPGSVTIEVGECIELATPEQRLACFEAQVEAARQDPKPAAAARAPEPAAASTAVAVGAATAEQAGSGSRRDEPETPPLEIFAKVTELRETVPNAYLITLDNGQVWRQTRPLSYPLRPGSEVRIYETRWGTRLTNPEARGFIQVERAR